MITAKPSPYLPRLKPCPGTGPKGPNVTLIVGIKTTDSVVLAAETEESAGITAKRNIFKLRRIEGPDWVVVAGGAGDSVIVENATRRIRWALADCSDLTEQKLGDILDQVLATVYGKYIDTDKRPEGISLMLGASIRNELYLVTTQKRTFQFHDDYAYAGLGADLAIYYLDNLFSDIRDWKDATRVCGFVLMEAKKTAQYCSGKTQIYTVQLPPQPRWRSLGKGTFVEIENVCSGLVSHTVSSGIMKELRRVDVSIAVDEFGDYEEEKRPKPSSARKSKGQP